MASVPEASAPSTKHLRMPPQVKYIVGNEGAERFSYYGMRAILVVFMQQYLLMHESDAKGVFHLFVAFCYLFPLLGGFIADRYLGRYRTVLYLSFFYCAGHLALAVFEGTKWGLYLGLGLIALGSGAIKPCVSTFVGDQFDASNKALLPKVYGLFYWMINFGSMFSNLLIPWTREKYGPALAFGIPGILMALATFIFWLGRKHYHLVPPTGDDPNSFTRVLGSVLRRDKPMLVVAVSIVFIVFALIMKTILGIIGVPTEIAVFGHAVPLVEVAMGIALVTAVVAYLTQPAGAKPLLEHARGRFPEHAIEGASAAINVMKLFVWVSIFWALFDQHASSWVVQASSMVREVWEGDVRDGSVLGIIASVLGNDRVPVGHEDAAQTLFHLGGGISHWKFVLTPDQIPSLNPAMVMIIIPIVTALVYPAFEKWKMPLTPLRRMTIGMFFAAASFLVIAALQARMNAGAHVHVLWQAVAFFMLTAGEVLVSVTGLEFAYTQAPRAMKSTIMSFWLLTVFFGNVVAGYLEKAEFFGPFGQFIMFAAMMGSVGVLFAFVARRYQGREYIGDEEPPRAETPTSAKVGLDAEPASA